MVKAYLRYELTSSWGVICSNSNVTYDRSGKYLITSSLENVSLWNPRQGVLVRARRRPAISLGRHLGWSCSLTLAMFVQPVCTPTN